VSGRRALGVALALALVLGGGSAARVAAGARDEAAWFGEAPGPDVDDASPQVTRLELPFSGAWGVVQGARLPPRGAPLARFACFGRPVLAPADGTVVRVATGARDWPAHVKGRDEGNYAVIEHAPHEYSELRHLRAGSVRVTVGQRVRRGDVVGACGNSGNAGTPHVHFGFLSSIDPIATRPATFARYEVREPDRDAWHAPAGPLRPGDIVRPLP
jgi:murein DD-endopeptidase MepM/ murein hydrolase activator NlpD